MIHESPPPPSNRSVAAIVACVVVTLVSLGLDLGTKQWALEHLSGERVGFDPPLCEPDELGRMYFQRERTDAIVLVPGYLEFRYAENCGAAFSMLRDAPAAVRGTVFGLAATLASAVLGFMFVRGRGGPLFAASVPLIVSGAIGNLVDRFRLGYVVDFIRFHLQEKWEYPTFNVADITISIGIALLLIDGFREERRLKNARRNDQTPPEAPAAERP